MTDGLSHAGTLDMQSFNAIAELAYRESGLTLVPEKTPMIQSRLRHRLRALGLDDFAAYSSFVHSESGAGERQHLISALTTNVSHFFREVHHFDELRDRVRRALPDLRAGGRFRIWSAGCSRGQEALSAAITLLDDMPEVARLDLRILATDIDEEVVHFARQGRFPLRLAEGMPDEIRERFFTKIANTGPTPELAADPAAMKLITFRKLNLLSDWPMRQAFDVIFCRNVVIYFDVATQNRLWPRLRAQLKPGGLLMLGHSERITNPAQFDFGNAGTTTYRAE